MSAISSYLKARKIRRARDRGQAEAGRVQRQP